MTILTSGITYPARPGQVLYPVGPGEASVCWTCFRPRTELSITADRRIGGGELVRTCGPCFHALASGRAVELPSLFELPELLRSWARWNVNGEVDDDFTERMLEELFPGLSENDRISWFMELQAALLEVQEREEPGFELASVEPEARDVEALIADSVAKADECIAKLRAGAR